MYSLTADQSAVLNFLRVSRAARLPFSREVIVKNDSRKSRAGGLTTTLLGLGISFYIFLSFSGWVLVVAPALGILSCYPLYLVTQNS